MGWSCDGDKGGKGAQESSERIHRREKGCSLELWTEDGRQRNRQRRPHYIRDCIHGSVGREVLHKGNDAIAEDMYLK